MHLLYKYYYYFITFCGRKQEYILDIELLVRFSVYHFKIKIQRFLKLFDFNLCNFNRVFTFQTEPAVKV